MSAAAGLQCGFGEFLGADTLAAVRAAGFSVVRLDLQGQGADGRPLPDGLPLEKTALLAQEVVDQGLQPLCIIRRAEQMTVLPDGALVEFGNEPDLAKFGWTRESYLKEARRCVAIARETKRRLYLGVVSNLNKRGFDFLESLPWHEWPWIEHDSQIACSVHRYPDGRDPRNPHKGCKSREHEIAKLKAIVGPRALALTEVGYSDGPGYWSECEVAAHMAWERQFFSAHGFELCVAFQLNDGPPENRTTEAHFGFRRYGTGEWKPVAKAFTQAV
ncbi:MAG TPA: hypothetical protein VEC39_14635 [Vicinamibacterales bacterium]|nr:hypothetical protein [Vicinamibacterales bacterium]